MSVALVTGASRGGGKGIALALGEHAMTVYVTGRSVRGEPTTLGRPGTIDDTADEVTARGGEGIAVRCDHTDDSQVEALFGRIQHEHGRLDLVVNNAWSGYELPLYYETPFWEMEWRHWDLMFHGGLRAMFASMLPHGVTFYEVVKNATNKLTEQMADDLRPHGWRASPCRPAGCGSSGWTCRRSRWRRTESPEFPGRGIAALAADPRVMEKSGRVFTTPELAREYGFTDVDGKQQSAFWDEHWAARDQTAD